MAGGPGGKPQFPFFPPLGASTAATLETSRRRSRLKASRSPSVRAAMKASSTATCAAWTSTASSIPSGVASRMEPRRSLGSGRRRSAPPLFELVDSGGEAAGRHDHLVQKVLRLKPVTGTSRDRADHLHVAATEPEGLERLVDQAVHPLNEPGHAGHERFALDVALGEGGAPFFFEDVEEVGGSGGRGFSQRFHRRAVLLSKRKS